MLIVESLRPGRLVFRGLNLIDITLLLIFCIVCLFVLFVTTMFCWWPSLVLLLLLLLSLSHTGRDAADGVEGGGGGGGGGLADGKRGATLWIGMWGAAPWIGIWGATPWVLQKIVGEQTWWDLEELWDRKSNKFISNSQTNYNQTRFLLSPDQLEWEPGGDENWESWNT